ncbi:MAG: hypothetical protein HY866_08340 [Chloroflexi bacterium]|nr:hypothetical protein [Chloroflexota bacterium]
MENVLAAFLIIFILLFGVLTLSETLMSTQDTLQETWQEMQTRQDDQARTSLLPIAAHTENMGTVVELTLYNNGSARLTDFDHWDAILLYFDAGTPSVYHTTWLPYTDQVPNGGEWTIAGIYLNTMTAEMIEPGILNSGEDIVLRLRGTAPIGEGTGAQVVISTANGVEVSFVFTANLLPVLETNAGLTIGLGATAEIGSGLLRSTDGDDLPADLVYVITTPPAQGTLSLGATFTQADIDAGQLSYSHTGTETDGFQFTVSDGKDTIGPYAFTITPSAPPVLAVNIGLTMLAGGSVTINGAQLLTTDADDLPNSLVYSVTAAPEQGRLNLGSTFTQTELDGDLLEYTHTGLGDDSFQFVVSDGETLIGPYNMVILAR